MVENELRYTCSMVELGNFMPNNTAAEIKTRVITLGYDYGQVIANVLASSNRLIAALKANGFKQVSKYKGSGGTQVLTFIKVLRPVVAAKPKTKAVKSKGKAATAGKKAKAKRVKRPTTRTY